MDIASKFANIETAGQATTSKKKKTLPEIEMENMEKLAALDFEIKALTTMRETLIANSIKPDAFKIWLDKGAALGSNPGSFKGIEKGDIAKGVEDGSSANCELRIKGSNRKLDETVVTLMTDLQLPVAKKVLVDGTIRMNPIYVGDKKYEALINRVWDACQRIKDLPDNFWQLQTEESYPYVGETAIDDLFNGLKAGDIAREDAEMMLPLITEPSFGKTKLKTDDEDETRVKSHAREIIEMIIKGGTVVINEPAEAEAAPVKAKSKAKR